uniref:LAM_G_DOMAIN domain-containing protein n=1 Tax=Syphacia muris TaxID=451379 RepID=A0A0N5AY79_9BILA
MEFLVSHKAYEAQNRYKALGFDGYSHMLFPSPENAYLETNITIEFKFDKNTDGVLLFAGSTKDSDFIAISIKNDSILLRFDCGEGTVEDLYRGPLEKNVWHSLHVFRKFCAQSEIQIDNRNAMTDDITELVHYKGITVDQGIFVGGATTEIVSLEEKAGTTSGFVGCIRKIVVNDVALLDSQEGINLSLDEATYCNLDEPKVYLGKKLVKKTDNTTDKKSGVNTFQSKNVGFSGNSYVQLLAPDDIDRYMELRISIKLKEPNGIIYFDRTWNRILAIYLENSFVFVLFSIGNDQTLLRSEFQLPLNVWKKLEVWRSGRAILLKVANQMWIEGRIFATDIQESATKTTYFGGAPMDVLPEQLKTMKGFFGCMRKICQNARMLHLHRDALVSVNTHDCGWNPCFEMSCEQSSRCINQHTSAVCLCKYPLRGKRCEYKNDVKFTTKAMRFSGISYLRFASREVMEHIMGETLNLRFTLRLQKLEYKSSQSSEQILVYAASNDNDGDYMKLRLLKDKKLELLVDLGSGVTVVSHPIILNEESWHDVVILREASQISLIVDELEVSTTATGDSTELNVYDSLFIGGALSGDKLYNGFKGCLRNIVIDSASVTHPEHASEAINLSEC